MNLVYFVLFIISLFGYQKSNNENPTLLDLSDALKSTSQIKSSKIVSRFEYIKLSSERNHMIGGSPKFYVNDSVIICISFKQIFLFDRKTGEFIKEIGEHGRGPNAYWATRSVGSVDFKNNVIYATAYNKLIGYSFDNKVISSVDIPYEYKNTTPFNKNLFASYIVNQSGDEKRRIILYDLKEKKIVKIFPNHQKYNKIKGKHRKLPYNESWFYKYDERLFFKEYLNDTLYEVKINKLEPRFVFKSGEFSPPYEDRETFQITKYHYISNIFENNNFLFFTLSFKKRNHWSIYDKKEGKCVVSNFKNKKKCGFKNDIDGFAEFRPLSINHYTNELVGYLSPLEIIEWFEKNPQLIKKLPTHLRNLKNINYTDNPVVMIAKLKE